MASSFVVSVLSDHLAGLAQKLGLDPNSKSGMLPEQNGVLLSYTVSGGYIVDITLTVEKKPHLVPMSLIESKVKALIGG